VTDLAQAHAALQAALEPLGVEVGPEVLALWIDREAHGREPLPTDALKRLADVAQRLLADGAERD
jgi:hypothetical protein